MMNDVIENRVIDSLVRRFQRSASQINRPHESDAELVRLGSGLLLAVTIDTIAEEISTGLYRDPYLIGWMTVTASMSDLAAVGAQPIGIVLSELLPQSYPDADLDRLQHGIEDACSAYQTFVLGGDTNRSDHLVTTGCAIGVISGQGHPVGRIGCKPGDALYATGKLGSGNAFAMMQFAGVAGKSFPYQPSARIREGELLTPFVSSRMDSSDGFLATLDQLMRLNHVGFTLGDRWAPALSSEAADATTKFGIPPWLFLAGQHGEFELVFTVRPESESALHEMCVRNNMNPIRLGEVTRKPEISLMLYGATVTLDTARIRNAGSGGDGSVDGYIQQLLRMDAEIRKEVRNHEYA